MSESRFTVCLHRYSTDPAAMATFLEALGLSRAPTTGAGALAVLGSHSGSVAVHHADSGAPVAAGETQLGFDVADPERAAAELVEDGLDVAAAAEAIGESPAVVTDPRGGRIRLDRASHPSSDDLRPDPSANTSPVQVEVVGVYFSRDFATDAAFFRHFGFLPDEYGSEHWQTLETAGAQGIIGLHPTNDQTRLGRASADSPACLVDLSFGTSDLEAVADRLVAGGYDATIVHEPYLSAVHVTDPDGRALEVHQSGKP